MGAMDDLINGSVQAVAEPSQGQETEQAAAGSPYYPPTPTEQDQSLAAPAEATGKYVEDVLGQSQTETAKDWAFWDALTGKNSYENVSQQFTPTNEQLLRSQRVTAYRAHVTPNTLSAMGQYVEDAALESAPGMIQAIGGGLAGGAVAVGASLALGGAPLLIGGLGFAAGTAAIMSMTMGGKLYGELRARGLSHDQAKLWSYAGGYLEGIAGNAKIQGLPRFMIGAYEGARKSGVGRAAFVQAWGRFIVHSGEAGLIGAGQEMADQGIQFAGAMVNNGKVPDVNESIAAVVEAAKKNLALAIPLHGAGVLTGNLVKAASAIVDQHKGEPIKAGVSIDVAASQAKVDQLVAEAQTLEQQYDQIIKTVDNLRADDKDVPPSLLQAYTMAKDGLEAANAKAAKAIDDLKAQTEFESLPADERVTEAEDQRKLADERLKTLRMAIETAEDNGVDTALLREKRKQARIDLRIATERKREAELTLERETLEEKATKPGAGEGVKLSAQSAMNKIDKELYQIKVSQVGRDIEAKKQELESDLSNVQNEIDKREKENRTKAKELIGKATSDKGYEPIPAHYDAEKRTEIEAEVEKRNPVGRLKAKEEKLQGQIESVKTLQELIREGLLNEDDMAALKTKVSSTKLDSLARLAKQLVGKVARDTEQEARQQVKSVDRVVRLSGLTQAEQAKLKAFTPGDDLAAYLDYLDERIKELVEKRETADAKQKLQIAKKRTQPTEVNKMLRGLPLVQGILTLYRHFIDNPDEAEQVLQEPVTVEDILKEPELGAVHPLLRNAIAHEVLEADTPEAIEALAEHIQEIADKGLKERERRIEEYVNELRAVVSQANEALPEAVGKNYENRNFIARHFLSGRDTVMATWDAMVEVALQFTDSEKANAVRELLSVRKAVDAERAAINAAKVRMIDTLTGGSIKNTVKIVESVQKRYRKDAPTPELANATDDVLMQIYGWMQDPSLESRLVHGNKFTLRGAKSTKAWIEKQIGPEGVAMVGAMKDFYRWLYARANEAHINKFGYPLADNPHYSGPAKAVLEDAPTNDFLKAVMETSAIVPGFLKRTIQNVNALPLDVGLIKNATGYINGLEHFKAFTETGVGDRLHAIMSDATFKAKVKHLYGEKFFQRMEIAYKDITGVKPVILDRLPFVVDVMRSVGNVIHSPLQLVKQSTGALMYLKYENPVDLLTGMAEVAMNFEKYEKIFSGFDFIKAREHGKYRKLETRLENVNRLGGDNMVKRGLAVLQDIQSMPLEGADKANILFGGGALYVNALKRGMTEAEAEHYMATASVSTQGSSLIDQRTPMERNALGAALSQFTKPAVQAHFAAASDMRRFLAQPSLETAAQAIKSGFAVRVAEIAFVAAGAAPALLGAALLASNGDERKFNDAVIDFVTSEFLATAFGPATGLPALGRIVANFSMKSMISAAQHGKNHEYETQIPILEMGTQFIKLSQESADVAFRNKELSREEAYTILRAFNRSVIMGTTQLNFDWILGLTRFMLDYNETPEEKKQRKREDRRHHKQVLAGR